ncbi:MAG: SEL1-like repeat protein [Prosthecobacter sp.]|nr:SEL1-like repeat protein [Prosthecobacter sp.]
MSKGIAMTAITWRSILVCVILCLTFSESADAQPLPSPEDAAARCADSALRKEGRDITPLNNSFALLNLEPIFEAVADCRFALRAMPTDKQMIIAEHFAGEALTILVIGMKAPTDAEAIFASAMRECAKVQRTDTFQQRFCAFFMGSAYEYGVGVKADSNIAWKWYLLAGQTGSKIALREAARLEQSLPR